MATGTLAHLWLSGALPVQGRPESEERIPRDSGELAATLMLFPIQTQIDW